MKKFVWLCAAFAAMSSVYADAVFFRSGRVLRTEVSSIKPYSFKRLCASEPPRPAAYAAVTVKLDKGRKIGIFDYSLRIGGKTYDCAMIRDNSTRESGEIADGGDRRRCTLFFEIDESAAQDPGKARLICNAPGRGEVELVVTDRGERSFTPDARIPDPGAAEPGK